MNLIESEKNHELLTYNYRLYKPQLKNYKAGKSKLTSNYVELQAAYLQRSQTPTNIFLG